jgi:hypothetical protein
MPKQTLTRIQKILYILYKLSKGSSKKIRFEDIVVALFKEFPDEFHLKGYKQYPDSGDIVHKPLYDAKKKGFILAASKTFSLTTSGIDFAEEIVNISKDKKIVSNNRLSRSSTQELDRVSRLDGFVNLFLANNKDELLDTDFYKYLGVTVRTEKNIFEGRLKTMESFINEISKNKKNTYQDIVKYHKFILDKFKYIVEKKLDK